MIVSSQTVNTTQMLWIIVILVAKKCKIMQNYVLALRTLDLIFVLKIWGKLVQISSSILNLMFDLSLTNLWRNLSVR